MTKHLFVYGTLRPGSAQPLAVRLRRQARLIGAGTAPGILYDLGGYPGALFHPDLNSRVLGDVFILGNAEGLLKRLDEYEDVGGKVFTHYERYTIRVVLARGRALEAWTYGLRAAPARARRIGSGDFIAHARAICPRPLRP